MKLYELYFSPTGGTKKVTKYLSTAWTCEKEELDLMSGENMVVPQLDATDICIVAVPSYAGRVPAFAADVLKRISGNHAKAVLVAVYGNREFEDTLIEFTLPKEINFCPCTLITSTELISSDEGEMYWVDKKDISNLDAVADLQEMIDVILDENLTEFQYVREDDEWKVIIK